jgi:hypothetical protein
MMARYFAAVLAVLPVVMGAGASKASNCAVDDYEHNGSVMEVQECDGELFISYSKPKASLRKIGVKPGTTLFEGRISRIGAVFGKARRFSAKCGEITYDVEGAIRPNSILLEGQAPVRNSSCLVTEYRRDELLFTLEGYAEKVADANWYAIAGAFTERAGADRRVRTLSRKWRVMDSNDCPNFTAGYWLVAAGPMPEVTARKTTGEARKYEAYAKSCE